jgi:hypothetical protein
MGILDEKAFLAACKKKAANDVSKKAENYDLEGESILLLTKWEDEITQPDWHPFKVIDVNGHAKVNLILLVLLLLGEQHKLLDRVFGSPLVCMQYYFYANLSAIVKFSQVYIYTIFEFQLDGFCIADLRPCSSSENTVRLTGRYQL